MVDVKDWPEYSDVLQEPIAYPHLTILKHRGDTERLLSEFRKHVAKTRAKKTDALFALYEIDPNSPKSWRTLAFALASRHVPGFQMETWPDFNKPRARMPRRPGRPSHIRKPGTPESREVAEERVCRDQKPQPIGVVEQRMQYNKKTQGLAGDPASQEFTIEREKAQ